MGTYKSISQNNPHFCYRKISRLAMCKICSKLTIKTPERRHWRRCGVFIANFEQILHIVLVFYNHAFE